MKTCKNWRKTKAFCALKFKGGGFRKSKQNLALNFVEKARREMGFIGENGKAGPAGAQEIL